MKLSSLMRIQQIVQLRKHCNILIELLLMIEEESLTAEMPVHRVRCGDILVFIDADATLSSDFLFQCHQVFQNSAVAGMTGIAQPSDGGIMQRFVYRGTYCLVRIFHLFNVSLFPGICIAYRRDAFKKLGGFREDFGIVEDLDLSRRMSRLGKCTINKKAHAFVSTRRLEKHLFSTVTFHIYSDIKYLLTGKTSTYYPKAEEVNSWKDLWQNH